MLGVTGAGVALESFEQRSKWAYLLRAKLLYGQLCEGELVNALGRGLLGDTGQGPRQEQVVQVGAEGLSANSSEGRKSQEPE